MKSGAKKTGLEFGFIIGTGRCGTTMLSQMLNAHSDICVPHELQILFEYSNNGPRLYKAFKEKKNEYFQAADFINLVETRCPYKFHEYFDYKSFFKRQRYPIRSNKKLVQDLYGAIAASQGKKIFMEQTPWYGQRLDIVDELFPDAKYIHLIRDGRDVAISFARTPWWHDDIGRNLERWHAEVSRIIESSEQILKPGQMLQVRYEDLVDQPESGLRRICGFLGVDFEETMLDPTTYIDYIAYGKSDLRTVSSPAWKAWSENMTSPTFRESQYAWKNFRDFDFSTVPAHIRRSLQALGYE